VVHNRFAIYGLSENPFPGVAVADRNDPGPFVPFDKKFMEKIFFLIDISIEQKAWRGIPLIGKIGSGKTRLLLEIQSKYADRKEVKIIFVDNPGLSLKEFYASIIDEFIKDGNVLAFLFQRYRESLLEVISKHSQRGLEYPTKILFDLSRRGLVYDVLTNLMQREGLFLDKSLARSFAIILANEIFQRENFFKGRVSFVGSNMGLLKDFGIARDFLKGRRISRTDSAKLGYMEQELDDKTIIDFGLKPLIEISKLMGHQMIIVLVDQFERIIEHLPTRTMLNLLDGYRSLIDKNLDRFTAVFACTTESWFESATAYPSFKDRFSDPLEIPRITFDVAKSLIVAYCDRYRILEDYKGSIFPFDEESISYILSKSSTVRDFLENCNIVLSRASIDGVKRIDKKTITKFM